MAYRPMTGPTILLFRIRMYLDSHDGFDQGPRGLGGGGGGGVLYNILFVFLVCGVYIIIDMCVCSVGRFLAL
jgi:hypothetical protein